MLSTISFTLAYFEVMLIPFIFWCVFHYSFFATRIQRENIHLKIKNDSLEERLNRFYEQQESVDNMTNEGGGL